MKKHLLTLFIILISAANAFSQIKIQNPSFEGVVQADYVPPPWIISSPSPDTDPCNFVPQTFNLPASNGLTYCGMFVNSSPNNYYESFGQKLSCNLAKGQVHVLTIDIAYVKASTIISPGQLTIYGGFNIKDTAQLLWRSPKVDTIWHSYTATFIPNDNYNYIILWPYVDSAFHFSYVVVDNMSDSIYVQNAGRVKGMADSTDIHTGTCISLSAQVIGTEYTSVNWTSIPIGFIDTSLNAGTVCPTQNTKYIITITDTCGLTSRDTVNVNIIRDSVNDIGVPSLVVINTASQWQIQNLPAKTGLSIYDVLGRLVYFSNDYQNDFTPYQLPSATYLYQLRFSNGGVRNGKIVVIR